MARYTSILYTPTISVSSGVAATQVLSATETIGSVEAGWLDSVLAYGLADITRGFTMYLYGANVSVGAESAAFAPSDTATDDLLTIINFSSGGWVDLTNNRFIMKSSAEGDAGLGVWLQGTSPSTDAAIYCALIANTNTAIPYTANGLKFRFNFRHE